MAPPCGEPLFVGNKLHSYTNPDFKNCFIILLSIEIFSCSQPWLMLSKQPLVSPSNIHVGEHFLASTQNICSQASFALLPLRNPKEMWSPVVSATGSSARAYNVHSSVIHGGDSQRSLLVLAFLFNVDSSERFCSVAFICKC